MDFQYFKNPNLNVLNCTHCDLDGVGSHLVVKTVYPTAKYAKMFYGVDTDLLTFNTIPNKEQYNAIVFTDYTPAKFMKNVRAVGIPTLVLDHHSTMSELNDPANCVFIDTSACGARLAYDFYHDVKNISHLEELIGYIDTFDRWVRTDLERFKHACRLNMIFKEKYKYNFDAWLEAYKDGHTDFTEDEIALLDRIENEVDEVYNKLQLTDLPGGGALTRCDKHSTEVGINIQNTEKYNYWINIYNDRKTGKIGLMFRGYNPNISFDLFARKIELHVPGSSMGGHGLSCGGKALNESDAMRMISMSIPYIQQQIDGTFVQDEEMIAKPDEQL